MSNFKVAICMITYNHENFIRQAIEGVLMQVTNFDYQLIIGEDCSTDNTRNICIEYQKKYPDKIILRLPEKNLGAMINFIINLENCSQNFKYTAMCEGDDYWIDPYKLQKQVDYLENNLNCGLIYTDVKIYDDLKKSYIDRPPKFVNNPDNVVEELIKTKYIEFPSIAVRNSILIKIIKILKPELIDKIIGDTRLVLEFAQLSKIGYLPEQTAVYRIVADSASRPKNISKLIFASADTYLLRKTFLKRYNLNKKMLALPLCNFNRSMIFYAYNQSNYINTLKFLSNIILVDLFEYCDFTTFRRKTDLKLIFKFFLAITAISSFKNFIKKA